MSTMLRKRIFRIKRRARLKTLRSMSVFTLYSYIRTFRQITYGIISNLAKRPYIRIKSEDRHAAYCFKPGPSLYPDN